MAERETRVASNSQCNQSEVLRGNEEREMNKKKAQKVLKKLVNSEQSSNNTENPKCSNCATWSKADMCALDEKLNIEIMNGKDLFYIRTTIDTIVDLVSKKLLPYSIVQDFVMPWFHEQDQKRRVYISDRIIPPFKVSLETMLKTMTEKQRKMFQDMYEKKIKAQIENKVSLEGAYPLFSQAFQQLFDKIKKKPNVEGIVKKTEAKSEPHKEPKKNKAADESLKQDVHCKETKLKVRETIKVRDQKENDIVLKVARDMGIKVKDGTTEDTKVGKNNISASLPDKPKQETLSKKSKDNKELIKAFKEAATEALQANRKESKIFKLEEACRNTVDLLKYQRTHSVTYMHDILPFLRSIYREYKSKEISCISAHEIVVLDQIAFNVDLYLDISKTERLYKETLLDGHIFLNRHIIKVIQSLLSTLYITNNNNNNNTCKDKSKRDNGNFILLMDAALEGIYDIDLDRNKKDLNLEICRNVLEIVKDILCTAYSIALVCDEYDSKSIKGTSKTVLDDLESIKTDVDNLQDIAMCNLLIDSFCDNLCALERKVNTAVLRLTVETFARCEDKINDLYYQCTVNNMTESQKESIDNCVGEVDNEIDKIMQIGWFAIECSGYSKHSRKLRSALATIEALEDELVPGLLTMKKRANETYIEIVLIRMLDAIKDMRTALYNIMDPYAFCLVVVGQVEKIVGNFKTQISRNQLYFEKCLRYLRCCSIMVQEMINNSVETDDESFKTCQLKAMTEARDDLNKILTEIKKRFDGLFAEPTDLVLALKMLKRLKVFEHELSKLVKLSYRFGDEFLEEEDLFEHKTVLEESVQNDRVSKTTKNTMDIAEEQAKKLIRNRSVIGNNNNTPMKKHKSLKLLMNKKNTGKSKNVLIAALDKKRITNKFVSFNETVYNAKDLEVTTVLGKICNEA